jgi:hypothetical protein
VGSSASDSALSLTVPCGPVTIEARIDWERGPRSVVNATPERTPEIEVANNLGPLYLPYLWRFARRPYLVLRQLTTLKSELAFELLDVATRTPRALMISFTPVS